MPSASHLPSNTFSRRLKPGRLAWCLSFLILGLGLSVSGLASAKESTGAFGSSDEPLPVEVAFAASGEAVSAEQLAVSFKIADGYYLYRDKLSFKLADDSKGASGLNGAALGKPVLPEALIVDDEFFGESATYRDTALIILPLTNPSSSDSLAVDVKFQGCADIGLCYPPTTTRLEIATASILATPLGTSGVALASSALFSTSDSAPGDSAPASQSRLPKLNKQSLGDLFGSSNVDEELLSPDQAYLPQIITANAAGITLDWTIEDGYYLYRDKQKLELVDADGSTIVSVDSDVGTIQFDEFFGDVAVWRNNARSVIGIDSVPADRSAELVVRWQGCADIGVCFPPQTTRIPVVFDQVIAAAGSVAAKGPDAGQSGQATAALSDTSTKGMVRTAASSDSTLVAAAAATGTDAPRQSEQDRLSTMLANSSLWLTVLSFFGFGLLLAFTPCVLPMIPILSSLIVGQGDTISSGKAFRLSLVYVLVMASTYALVGIAVGMTGYNVQIFLQNPWVLSSLAVLFVVLSLSMFGFFELQLPVALQQKLTSVSNKQKGGSVGGVAAMGFISTLIVGPCVTAPLAGALIYIANTGDAFIGGVALFALGLGMGAPLLLIGTSAGSLLPRAGMWMNKVKAVFGVMLLGLAIWMVSRFIDPQITFALAGVLILMSGVHLGAFDSLKAESTGRQRFAKGAGLVVALYGVALLIGTMSGGSSWTSPLKGLSTTSTVAMPVGPAGQLANSNVDEHGLVFQRIKTVADLEATVAAANARGQSVMLDFYADWCISCKEMEKFTFTDAGVQASLTNSVLIQADVTANDADDKELLKRFSLFGPPAIIFWDVSGTELPAARVVGFMKAARFSDHIQSFSLSDT